LEVWDYATRVEALVDLEAFEQASESLDDYLVHTSMNALEVSSTYRQFNEVLKLSNDSRGAPLLRRLATAAERLRGGGASQTGVKGARSMLVRVSDPLWAPKIPDLVIHARLGTVVSISGSDRTIDALLTDPIVGAIEESRPSGQMESARSLPFIRVAENYQGLSGIYSEKGGAALVAIIDDGIDVLHEAFLDDGGRTRIVGIWDQQDVDQPASPPSGFDFGRFHTQADVASYVAGKRVPDSLRRANNGHGTHVTSIAAGRKAGSFAGGVAPEAQLLIVISNADQPTGYSHAHLAALTFIDRMAESLKKPVVVNLSEGMNAGAHDGSSPLENMFDAFSQGGSKSGRVVVKSAGNERSKKSHAQLTIPVDGADTLMWKSPPGSREHLELWWDSANEYQFQLKSPAGNLSEWISEVNPSIEGYFKKHGPFQMGFIRRHPDNGDSVLKIEMQSGFSPISVGEWTLDIVAVRVPAKGVIHAWIERGGYPCAEFINHLSEDMTLSIPGTAHSVITVGAIDAGMPIKVGTFSSYGPTRDKREKPDISAPGVQVKAARRDSINEVVVMDGTSMAAPHVAGAIALLLSKTASSGGLVPTAMQIRAVLRQKTLNYSAQWDRGQGYGVLDVAALLGAF
jgi:subtilisin family serine protease